jgi:predicted neutral ceramidase superfamily lipid hydrolase
MEHSNNYRNKRKRYFLPRYFLVIVPIIVAISVRHIRDVVANSGLVDISNHPGINGALFSFVSMLLAVFLGVILYFFLIVYYNHKKEKKGNI